MWTPNREPSPTALADLVARLGGDDDPDLRDTGGGHGLDAVEQDRLVRHRHQLLGAGVRDRTQARALAPRQNQPLQRSATAGSVHVVDSVAVMFDLEATWSGSGYAGDRSSPSCTGLTSRTIPFENVESSGRRAARWHSPTWRTSWSARAAAATASSTTCCSGRVGDAWRRGRPASPASGAQRGTDRRAPTCCCASVDGEDLAADVGFGSGTLLEPIPLGPGRNPRAGGLALPRRRRTARSSSCRRPAAARWVDGVRVRAPSRAPLIDIETSNWYTATHPRSPFVAPASSAAISTRTPSRYRERLDAAADPNELTPGAGPSHAGGRGTVRDLQSAAVAASGDLVPTTLGIADGSVGTAELAVVPGGRPARRELQRRALGRLHLYHDEDLPACAAA